MNQVFCLLSEIKELEVFEFEGVEYRRLAYDEQDVNGIPCCSQCNRLRVFTKDVKVRRCKDFGWRLHTYEELAKSEESSKSFSKMTAYFEKTLAAVISLDKEIEVVYSAYSTDDDDIPIDNMDEIAIQGKAILVNSDRAYSERSYKSKIVKNPSWLDLAVLANDMILTTGDTHHIFFEGIEPLDFRFPKSPEVPVYKFCMGS